MYQDLIVAIVDKYLAEEVMNAAKKAGARGGTILYGRGLDQKKQKKIFNLVIEPEKEVVLILSKVDETKNIVNMIDESLKISERKVGKLLILDILEALA